MVSPSYSRLHATPSDFKGVAEFEADRLGRVESNLDRWLPGGDVQPCKLHEAMRYAVLGDGKRIRPLLVYAAGQAGGADPEALDAPACAVELIHAYSLIHDDLPCMDDDDLRRGRPSCHRAFDEPTALLAGDALQSLAFYVLAHDARRWTPATAPTEMIETLAHAVGSRGMAGGQAMDLGAVGQTLNLAELESMHIHKTGALIRACVLLGAAAGPNTGTDPALLDRLDRFGKLIGLAFQVRDDILDAEGDTGTLGKESQADLYRNKPTYATVLGPGEAKREARRLYQEALASIEALGQEADPLRWLATLSVDRTY